MEESVAAAAEAPRMNFPQRLAGVFFEPTNTFRDINLRASWLGIFLIAGVLGMASAYTVSSRIDREAVMRKALESSPIKLTDEQINQQVQADAARQQNPLFKYGTLVLVPILTLITYLVIAGAFLLAFIILGASVNYKKSLAVTAWCYAPPGMIAAILSIIVLYLKEPGSVDVSHGVLMSNLGVLVDNKAHAVLGSLLSSIDIFSLWTIMLLSIGFAAISDRKLTTKKAATGVLLVWAVYVLGKIGWNAILSAISG